MEEEQMTCESCRHFCLHYVRWSGNKFMPMNEGHCVHPRLKNRKTGTPACQNYSARPKKKPEES